MQIIQRKTEELIPYERNQKKHDDKQIRNVANSIKRFGWQQPIVVDKKDVVVIGHCRLLAAKMLGLDSVPVTVADNLTDDEVRELRIADNKTNESAWDEDLLADDMSELSFDGFDFDFGSGPDADLNEDDGRYTTTVKIPQYEVKGENPAESDLYDDHKTQTLIAEIECADIPDEVKTFLKMAACRHTVFRYDKIAEYYAAADADVQELMEKSALVIIDVDDAIANGYAHLSSEIMEMMDDEG